jgi:hypothetical protein
LAPASKIRGGGARVHYARIKGDLSRIPTGKLA